MRYRKGEKRYDHYKELEIVFSDESSYSFRDIQLLISDVMVNTDTKDIIFYDNKETPHIKLIPPPPSTVLYNLHKMGKSGQLDKVRGKYYKKSNIRQGHQIFRIEKYSFKVGYDYFKDMDFKRALETAGCKVDKGNRLTGKNIQYCIEICKLIHFLWWTKMIAIRLDGRLNMLDKKNNPQMYDAISLLFGPIDNFFEKNVIFEGSRFHVYSTFTYNLGVGYISGKIKSSDDVRKYMKEIVAEIDKLIEKTSDPEDKIYCEMMRDEIQLLLENGLICKTIYQAINETIRFDGEPILTFKKSDEEPITS
jgi:hypothetical protein